MRNAKIINSFPEVFSGELLRNVNRSRYRICPEFYFAISNSLVAMHYPNFY